MSSNSEDDAIQEREVFWRDRYDFLRKAGYTLRPRYKPDWIPSWKTSGKRIIDCEDVVTVRVRLFPRYIRPVVIPGIFS